MSLYENLFDDIPAYQEMQAAYARMDDAYARRAEASARAQMFGLETSDYLPEITEAQAGSIVGVLEDWFNAIEGGYADLRTPDPFGEKVSPEKADELIAVIDDYIAFELHEHPDFHARAGWESKGKTMDMPADFNRLEGASRIAFAQDVFKKIREVFPPTNE